MNIEPDFSAAREYSCTSAAVDYQRWPIDKLTGGITAADVTVVTHVIIVVLARIACPSFTIASLDSMHIVRRAK